MMVKDAFDRWWEWAEKPSGSSLTIPAHFHDVTRIAVVRDPAYAAGIGQFAAIQTAATSAVELSVIDPRDAGDLKRAIATFAREPNGSLIVTGSASVAVHYELINSLATQHRLPRSIPSAMRY